MQHEFLASVRRFVDECIAPNADAWDRDQEVPRSLIRTLAAQGYLGAVVPAEWGGASMDPISFGVLCEEIGRGSGSVLSMLTVHSMVCQSVARWGTAEQKKRLLTRLARGDALGAFALTEPLVGSDARAIATTAFRDNEEYVLTGRKRWISMGQIADVALVFANVDKKATAFLVELERGGVKRTPLRDMLGFRAAMLAELEMDKCRVPADALLGRVGFGLSHVAGSALDLGRTCLASGCVGIIQACIDASTSYTNTRIAAGVKLKEHQLIKRMMANMIADVGAARLVCFHVCEKRQRGDPSSSTDACIAKYFASRAATRAANDAVQIHGANGCGPDFPVQRYLRDARVTEIIEGTNELQQMTIARHGHS